MDELVVIGKIKGGHGQNGMVKVLSLTDFPERFKQLKRVFLTSDANDLGSPYQVESVVCSEKFVKLKLADVNSLQQAWELNNLLVVLPLAERMPLEADSYYISDLLGLKVVDEAGNFLGTLTDVIETGATPVFSIENKGVETLVPVLEETIRKVDLAAKTVTIVPWSL